MCTLVQGRPDSPILAGARAAKGDLTNADLFNVDGSRNARFGAAGAPGVAQEQRSAVAPAFSAKDLTALAHRPLDHQRRQRLQPALFAADGINRDNVAQLKPAWRTSLNGSGTASKYSGASAADRLRRRHLRCDRRQRRLRARRRDRRDPLDLRGEPRPEHHGHLLRLDEPRRRDRRRQDLLGPARRQARRARSSDAAPSSGRSRRNAPRRLQHHDRAALLRRARHHGFRGRRPRAPRPRESVRRARRRARWTFYTIPGPGEFGHDTWPADNDTWEYGGAAVWQTPAVDPELGLVYFSTGNPGPDLNGSRAARRQSVQRLDRRDRGEDRQVPLALPAGASRSLGLRLAESRRAVRCASTTAGCARASSRSARRAMVYILDRETGKPLVGIEERAVPQEPRQATAADAALPDRRRRRAARDRHPAGGLQARQQRPNLHAVLGRARAREAARHRRRELAAELVRPRDATLSTSARTTAPRRTRRRKAASSG